MGKANSPFWNPQATSPWGGFPRGSGHVDWWFDAGRNDRCIRAHHCDSWKNQYPPGNGTNKSHLGKFGKSSTQKWQKGWDMLISNRGTAVSGSPHRWDLVLFYHPIGNIFQWYISGFSLSIGRTPTRIHGNGIFTCRNGWFSMVNVGKYTIHGLFGEGWCEFERPGRHEWRNMEFSLIWLKEVMRLSWVIWDMAYMVKQCIGL